MQDKTGRNRIKTNRFSQAIEILESISDAFFALDRDWRITYINKRAAGILNIKPQDLLGQNIWEKYPQLIGTELELNYRKAMAENQLQEFEIQGILTNHWYNIRVYSSTEGISAYWRDITECKKAEEPLRESEEKFRNLFENMTERFSLGEIILDTEGKPYDYRLLEVNQAWEKWLKIPREKAIGNTYRGLIPHVLPDIIARYGKTALTGEPATFEKYSLNTEAWISTYVYSPSKGRFAAITTDITARKKAEFEHIQLAEKRQHFLKIARDNIAEKDIDGLLSRVAKAAIDLTGGRVAAGGHGYVNGKFSVGGAYWIIGDSPCPPGKEFKMQKGGIYLELIKSQDSIRLSQGQLLKHPAWWGLPANHAPLKGLLGARMLDKNGQANGIIMVSDKAEGEFTEEDEHFLRELASITSLALQHLEARQDVEEKARELEAKVKERTQELALANEQLKAYGHRITQVQEEERKRIAYELHDDTAQYLSILKLELDSLLQSGKIQSPGILEKLEYLERDASRAVDDIRRYSHELRPGVLDHLGLLAALEQIADDINKLKQITVELVVEGDEPQMPDEVKLGLFRIAQEALHNARKHARASNATVKILFNGNQVRMVISDNGSGFDIQEAATRSSLKGSLGLMSMQERAKLIGANLKIESEPGKGTRIITVV